MWCNKKQFEPSFLRQQCGRCRFSHRVNQNVLPGQGGKIHDFGCGPGRDLKTFAERGHIAIGLEGAEQLAVMARAHSGCEVWQQDFLKLDLPESYFDGVFANAALFHVPSRQLLRVLMELKASRNLAVFSSA